MGLAKELLGYKGNRGFQEFEKWQILMQISALLYYKDEVNILDFITDGNR